MPNLLFNTKFSEIRVGLYSRDTNFRNPSLAIRVPENLSKARALSRTKEAIFKWFRDLETYLSTEENCPELLEDPCRIYNADEAGFPLNPKSEGKVLAEVGSKDVYAITSSDRTQITILACGNAAGIVIPPMAIFPGERFKYNPLHGCVPNTYLGRSKNGWMDSEVFYMWIANHFVNSIPPVRPVLLFVDGHATHIDKQTTQFCKENGIILYCLPAHASHIVQPLDVAFFRPLKLNWGKAVKKYKDNNPGQVVTKMVFSQVFKEAWDASNKPESLINGFRDSGLYPWNPAAINEGKFAPSAVFTKPPVENSNDSNGKEAVDEHVDHQQVASGDAPIACASPAVDNKSDSVTLPVTAATPHSSGDNLTTSASSVSFNHKISPIFDGIISYPKIVSSKPKRRSEIPKALTSKQMEMYLQAKSNEKQEKELNKQKRKEERQVKRQLKLENESKKKIQKKKGSLKKTQCGVCKQIYTEQSCAEWVGCDGVCDRWFHIKCTDIDVDFENLSPVEIQEEVAEIEWFCQKCLKS